MQNTIVGELEVKKLKATIVLLLILSFALVSISELRIVKAEETIYIRGDGSVEGTDKITQRNGNIYTFTDNIFSEIKVQRGNCVIDGAGYTLQGNWTGYSPNEYVMCKGIDLSNNRVSDPSRPKISEVTIKNMRIVNFTYGIECINSDNNIIINCYIADCGRSINMPNNVLIANNTIASGIFIDYNREDNVITQNNMINNYGPAADLVGVFLASQPTVYMNYWSDYNGTDNNGDGIGDTPYIINEDNQDNCPLMNPIEPTFIPEFPSWIILPLFLVATFVVLILKKRLSNQPVQSQNYHVIHHSSLSCEITKLCVSIMIFSSQISMFYLE